MAIRPFQLQSAFKPMGYQPPAIGHLTAGLAEGRRLVSETPAIVADSDEADVAMRELAVALLAGCGLDGDESIASARSRSCSDTKMCSNSPPGGTVAKILPLTRKEPK